MTQLHEKVADALTAEIGARTGWDEPPSLYFLYLDKDGPRFSDLDLPSHVWTAGRPPSVLETMAEAIHDWAGVLRGLMPPSMFGIGFMCEAWEVITPKNASIARQERDYADAVAHVIHERDDKIEIRFMHAVDRAGIIYYAALRRDTGRIFQRQIIYPRPGAIQSTGSVVDSLDRMLMGMLDVTLPERGEPDFPAYRLGKAKPRKAMGGHS